MNILVSHCLLGEPCRYDGRSVSVPALKQLEEAGYTLIPVCPEVLGGLPTPRSPAELQPDGRVLSKAGEDVTQAYQEGARKALEVARVNGCTLAVLKCKSPSCGDRQIYDGTFTQNLIDGQGVAAKLLTQAGIRVLGEDEINCILFTVCPRNPSKTVRR